MGWTLTGHCSYSSSLVRDWALLSGWNGSTDYPNASANLPWKILYFIKGQDSSLHRHQNPNHE
ncbi:unnamed protein product [Staurois parvus]|uniref:Uncharacterized protein n=1 Tax=Staurois parvus TaxID=386267 RepID=A0ABN9B8Q6_9NEOB|nr:unnamed protein product [Staurois parvus]